jgi:hypothetical protein
MEILQVISQYYTMVKHNVIYVIMFLLVGALHLVRWCPVGRSSILHTASIFRFDIDISIGTIT